MWSLFSFRQLVTMAVASGTEIEWATGSDNLFSHSCYVWWGLSVPIFFTSLSEIVNKAIWFLQYVYKIPWSDGPPWREVLLNQISEIQLKAIKESVLAFLRFQKIC